MTSVFIKQSSLMTGRRVGILRRAEKHLSFRYEKLKILSNIDGGRAK
jgi:hypothetical protein